MRNIDADFDAVFVGMFAQHLEGIVMPGLDDLDMVVIEGGSRDAIYRFHMPSRFCVDAARTNVDRGQGFVGSVFDTCQKVAEGRRPCHAWVLLLVLLYPT